MQSGSILQLSESRKARKLPFLPIDPIPKDAVPAQFDSSLLQKPSADKAEKKRGTLQPKTLPQSDFRIRGPDPTSVKVKQKPLLGTLTQKEVEEQKLEVSSKFWQNQSEEKAPAVPDAREGRKSKQRKGV